MKPPKSEVVTTRLTEIEALRVELSAQKEGISRSAYVRNKILTKQDMFKRKKTSLYYFTGDKFAEDERMTITQVKKHKEYRKLLNFLLSKRNGKRDI